MVSLPGCQAQRLLQTLLSRRPDQCSAPRLARAFLEHFPGRACPFSFGALPDPLPHLRWTGCHRELQTLADYRVFGWPAVVLLRDLVKLGCQNGVDMLTWGDSIC